MNAVRYSATAAGLLEQFTARPLPGDLPEELAALSDRELQITKLVARGRSNAKIGESLHLSEATVKTYVSRLLARLRLRDRLQIALLAYETGLVPAGGLGRTGGAGAACPGCPEHPIGVPRPGP